MLITSLTVSNSTFTGNTGNLGGGINGGGLVTNSTFIGNAATSFGGGIIGGWQGLIVTTTALSLATLPPSVAASTITVSQLRSQ